MSKDKAVKIFLLPTFSLNTKNNKNTKFHEVSLYCLEKMTNLLIVNKLNTGFQCNYSYKKLSIFLLYKRCLKFQ